MGPGVLEVFIASSANVLLAAIANTLFFKDFLREFMFSFTSYCPGPTNDFSTSNFTYIGFR